MSGRKHKDALEYTGDQIRDFPGETSERHVQASMQEETAKAIHRLADAVEELTEVVKEQE